MMNMNKLTLQKFMPICMILFSLIVYIIGILFVSNKISWTLGIAFGLIFSLLKFKLMENTFSKALQLPQAKAKSYVSFHYMIRFLLSGVVLFIAALEPSISMLGVVVGMLSMKVAAYMQLGFVKKNSTDADSLGQQEL